MNILKKLILCFLMITLIFTMQPKGILAADDATSYSGLYLIDGQNIQLNNVNISVSIESNSRSVIRASYEMTNIGESTEYVYLGIPVTDNKLSNIKFSFLPYWYNSTIVSGKEINQRIEDFTLDYKNWRTYSIPLAIKSKESKTAEISYTIENTVTAGGQIVVNIDMDHLKTWGEPSEKLTVEGYFNPRSVKVYNFENDINIEPTKMTSEYAYIWDINNKKHIEDISYSYYFVDEAIINNVKELNDNNLNSMIQLYREAEYSEAIDIGKKFIEKDSTGKQNIVYLFMVDAYMAEKRYKEALAVYDLIETDEEELKIISNKIEEKNLFNKVICYRELKNYTEMYTTISYELNYTNLNPYMVDWLNEQIKTIPEDKLSKIQEEYKPPTGIQKFLGQFIEGEISIKFVAAIFAVMVIITIILLILRRKRKNKYFF